MPTPRRMGARCLEFVVYLGCVYLNIYGLGVSLSPPLPTFQSLPSQCWDYRLTLMSSAFFFFHGWWGSELWCPCLYKGEHWIDWALSPAPTGKVQQVSSFGTRDGWGSCCPCLLQLKVGEGKNQSPCLYIFITIHRLYCFLRALQ